MIFNINRLLILEDMGKKKTCLQIFKHQNFHTHTKAFTVRVSERDHIPDLYPVLIGIFKEKICK